MILDETNAEYHAHAAISCSKLKDFERSPLFYFEKHVAHTIKREPTPAMALGSALHSAILEPERFDEEFVIKPKFDRRTKAGKQDALEWEAENGHRTPISEDDQRVIDRLSYPATNALQNVCGDDARKVEFVIRVETELGTLQARPDIMLGNGTLIDLKTTRDISAVRSQFWALGYHLQDSFYRLTYEYEFGHDPGPIKFLFLETQPPHEVGWLQVDEETATLSRHYVFGLLERLWQAYQSNRFEPIYSLSEPTEIAAPAWLRNKLEDTASESVVGLQALAAFETGGGA